MFVLRLIARNALRHRLRTTLTVVGLLVAIIAYGLLQTVIDAWYAGAQAASSTRLITRNSISLVFPLPLNYEARIRSIEGVSMVARSNWFGGIYQNPKNFFAQFAVSPNYLDLYPEFVLSEDQRQAWLRDRKGCLVGRQLADVYGFKVGDVLPLRGTLFPGTWEFVVRGIFEGSDETKITRQMMFHWDYLNETLRKSAQQRADQVGIYIVGVKSPESAPSVARAIDATFRNSLAETLTETEQSFQLGFVAMSNEIIAAIRIVSYVVIVIILAVMANTMAMSARERVAEYATLKALGFRPRFIALLIFGESAVICALGGGLAIASMPYVAAAFKHFAGEYFPVFEVSFLTLGLQAACALVVAAAAAVVPAVRAAQTRIVQGLRAIG
ncbi:MAG: FtsX-like permease family protein [Betaproteobacteria bacterium]|nr:MAG: FtsX-like permease family protein [Betaproteobacteria bacterium]